MMHPQAEASLTGDSTSSSPATVPNERTNPPRSSWIIIGFVVATALVSIAEHMAATGDATAHFYVFWLGYACVLVPAAAFILRSRRVDARLVSIVVALGVWGMVPKLLRSGHQILYFDEFDHFRILQDLFRTGHPVSQFGLLQIGANFPGLELFTSATSHLTGATLLNAALAVTVLVHVLCLLGMYELVGSLAHSQRAGAMAALIYSLNPSWLFFDSQFSYEGLAIAVLLWILVLVNRAVSRGPDRATRRASASLAVLLIVGLVTIHHVTALVLCGVLVLLSVVVLLRARRSPGPALESTSGVWALTAVAVAVTAVRLTSVGHLLFTYLAPTFQFSKLFASLLSLIGLGAGSPTRATLSGNLPGFEIVSAYMMVPVLFVAFVWSAVGLWQRHRIRPSLLGVLGILGLGYFASLSVVTVRQFSESVHRTWAFSFIGLAAIIGVALCEHVDGGLVIRRGVRQWWPHDRLGPARVRVLGVLALVVVAVGAVATGPTAQYRFGGPVTAGADAVAYGTQTTMVASWFADHARAGSVVFADRFVGHEIAIASQASFPKAIDLYGLTFDRHLPMAELDFVYSLHVGYIVVDRRMSSLVPGNGFWYGYTEPYAYTKHLVPARYVERYSCLLWLHAVFATSDYEVFRVDRTSLRDFIHVYQNNGIAPYCSSRGIT